MRHPHLVSGRRLRAALGAATLAAATLVPAVTARAVPVPEPVATVNPSAGSFYPVPATRLVGAATGQSLSPGVPLRVPVLGRPGLPTAGVSAVVVNVTVSATSARTTLVALRPGRGPLASARPTTSVTVPPDGTRTSLVTVPLDPEGALDVVTSSPALITVDLVGLYAADDTVVATFGSSGGYQPSDPVRLLGPGLGVEPAPPVGDTLDPTPSPTPTVDPVLASPLPGGGVRRVAVDLGDGTARHVTALLLRVSVVSAPSRGQVTVAADAASGARSSDGSVPLGPFGPPGPFGAAGPGAVPASPTSSPSTTLSTPTLSLDRGVTASNLAVVPALLDDEGLIRLTVSNGSSTTVPVVVDLVGFYDDGGLGADLRFRALPVGRVLDTRTGSGAAPLGTGGPRVVSPPADVVGDNTFALVGSLTTLTTSTGAQGVTELALRRDELAASAPTAATAGSLPAGAADQATTSVQAEVGASGRLVLTASSGPVEAVLDVVGSFEAYPAVEDPDLRDWVHAVPSWQVRALAR
ncbi:hypothetical protein V3N99_17175 [Dermatophilaceae bacterium Soc4.6]